MECTETKKPWKKNLYENFDYPDNYTDPSFLKDLKKNIDFKEITLTESIFGATLLIQELCTVIIFVLTYVYLFNEWIEPSFIFYSTSFITAIGFFIHRMFYATCGIKHNFNEDFKTLVIFLAFGKLFSPVLHTLTDTISTDTIYATTSYMLIIHLIFFDYGVPVAIVSHCFSLSAAMFGSICLASRLASPHHAFVLLTFAVESFVLFPLLRKKIKRSFFLTLGLIGVAIIMLWTVSQNLTFLFIVVIFVLNIVYPYLFQRYQSYKDNIYGPWDEAIVHDSDSITDLFKST